MIFKIFFLTLIVLLFFIFISSVHIYVSFFDKLTLKIRFWFFSFNLTESKNVQNKTIVTEKELKNVFGDALKKTGLIGFIDLLKDVINISSFAFKKLLRSVKVNHFVLNVNVVSEDSAMTAIRYGQVCSALYPLVSSLKSIVKIKNPCIEVHPDFKNTTSGSTVEFNSDVRISVFRLFAIAVSTLFYYTKRKRSFLNESASD